MSQIVLEAWLQSREAQVECTTRTDMALEVSGTMSQSGHDRPAPVPVYVLYELIAAMCVAGEVLQQGPPSQPAREPSRHSEEDMLMREVRLMLAGLPANGEARYGFPRG
jgi:hypothetical protein